MPQHACLVFDEAGDGHQAHFVGHLVGQNAGGHADHQRQPSRGAGRARHCNGSHAGAGGGRALEAAIDQLRELLGAAGLVVGPGHGHHRDHHQQRVDAGGSRGTDGRGQPSEFLSVVVVPPVDHRHHADGAPQQIGGVVGVQLIEPGLGNIELRLQCRRHRIEGGLVPVGQRQASRGGRISQQRLDRSQRLLHHRVVGRHALRGPKRPGDGVAPVEQPVITAAQARAQRRVEVVGVHRLVVNRRRPGSRASAYSPSCRLASIALS